MQIRDGARADGSSREARRGACLALLMACAVLAGPSAPARAQAEGFASPIEPAAKAILDRMAERLAKAPSIRVVVDLAWDSIQADGQKLEFGETRTISLRRPDRLRIETERRTGEKRGTIYDGKEIAVLDLDEKAWAAVAKTGSVDEILDYARDELDLRVPLGELFSAELGATLSESVRVASVVDVARIGGVACDHVAFRTDLVDVQLWIAQGDLPLPRRVVIVYRSEIGQPQFRADLRDWDVAGSLPDSLFQAAVPAGSERVPFATGARAPAGSK